jgi:hypothetical protein
VNGSSRLRRCIGIVVIILATCVSAGVMFADDPVLKLRAATNGASPVALTIELFRWSSDAERAPLLTALSAPPPLPPTTPEPAAGRGRGARGRGAAAPLSPVARLAAAIKAAPTVGFIWGDGVTGYSIKYAWRSPATGKGERIVLVVDRRLGAHASEEGTLPAASVEADFTLLDLRIDAKGVGEGKTSLAAPVVVDTTAQTLALDGYDAAPALLKVTR